MSGDSGGALLALRGGQYVIVATAEVSVTILYAHYLLIYQGGGYDCRSDSFTGLSGDWNNIPSRIDWIRRTLKEGVETGGK